MNMIVIVNTGWLDACILLHNFFQKHNNCVGTAEFCIQKFLATHHSQNYKLADYIHIQPQLNFKYVAELAITSLSYHTPDLLCHTYQQHTGGRHIYTSTIVLPHPITMKGGHNNVSMC